MHKASIAVAVASLFAVATLPAQAAISKADYKVGKERIEAKYKLDKERCKSLAANAKDICEAEIKGEKSVALADLEAEYKATDKAVMEARVARADAMYAVAKERCDDKAGNDKDVCVKAAKADLEKGKADAKASKKVAAARQDAAETKMKADDKADKQVSVAQKDAMQAKNDAEYKVAVERCDTFTGDRKTACITEAKNRFGKS